MKLRTYHLNINKLFYNTNICWIKSTCDEYITLLFTFMKSLESTKNLFVGCYCCYCFCFDFIVCCRYFQIELRGNWICSYIWMWNENNVAVWWFFFFLFCSLVCHQHKNKVSIVLFCVKLYGIFFVMWAWAKGRIECQDRGKIEEVCHARNLKLVSSDTNKFQQHVEYFFFFEYSCKNTHKIFCILYLFETN